MYLKILLISSGVLLGVDCLNGSFWTEQQTKAMYCHKLTLPSPIVYGPYERLPVSFMVDPVSASATGKSDLQVLIYFVMPGRIFSYGEHKIRTKISPGYSHNIGLGLFQYADNSGTRNCIKEGTRGVLRYSEDYTYHRCIEQCATLKEQIRCGCYSLIFARAEDDMPDCGVFGMVVCPFDSAEALGNLNFFKF